jgi:hypothetical protein
MNMQFVPDFAFDAGLLASGSAPTLDVEIKGPSELLPYGQRCAIRFEADATVTLLLGARDPRWADVTSYLAELVVAQLGIPLGKLRIFYTGMQPAVRRRPLPSARVLTRETVGGRIAAVGDLVVEACQLVIDRARRAYAIESSHHLRPVQFDRSNGRVHCDGAAPLTLLELANQQRHAS